MKASVSLKLTILMLQTDQFKIHTFLKYKARNKSPKLLLIQCDSKIYFD